MKNNYTIPISIGMFVVLIIALGYHTYQEDPEAKSSNNNSILDKPDNNLMPKEASEPIEPSFVVSGEKLKLNIKPQFKVGDMFKYKTIISWAGHEEIEDVYFIEEIKYINKSPSYIVSYKQKELIRNATVLELKIYINKETGEIEKALEIKDNNIEKEASKEEIFFGSRMREFFYVPWMLALKEDLKWSEEVEISMGERKYIQIMDYKVLEIEKINKIECFKVEIIFKEAKRIWQKKIIWVDTKRRIMIKSQMLTAENLLLYETNIT